MGAVGRQGTGWKDGGVSQHPRDAPLLLAFGGRTEPGCDLEYRPGLSYWSLNPQGQTQGLQR